MSFLSNKTSHGLKDAISDPLRVRNLCIMAHVDHGKTTLADCLMAHCGKICEHSSGKCLYMDTRQDEVERGITMKSSCVTFLTPNPKGGSENYLINLVDSPGHVDFSSEVSTAVRLCDGTIIVVDVLEGLRAQTKTVLKQAFAEGIKPILVLNKIDRLPLDKQFNHVDAFYHISQILEQVNAYIGEISNTNKFKKETINSECEESSDIDSVINISKWQISDVDDSQLYFTPERGNVIFASAYDSWGFRLSDFAKKFSSKLGIEERELEKGLWGDFYISQKGNQRKLAEGARQKGKEPLFASIILSNIFKVYSTVCGKKDAEETSRVARRLGIELSTMRSRSREYRELTKFIMSTWLPLAPCVLETVIEHLPSPVGISEERATKLMGSVTHDFHSLPESSQALRPYFQNCLKSDDAPIIVCVSKLFNVKSLLIKNTMKDLQGETDEESEHCVMGFARVFSGTLREGQQLYVLSPKHNPNDILSFVNANGNISEEDLEKCPHIQTVTIKNLFLLMGREFSPIKRAPAGLMVGIGGLEDVVIKSATLSSTVFCPTFTELTQHSKPIFRVAVEPEYVKDMKEFRTALNKLHQADLGVEVERDEIGQFILATAGEVHLERCITDLQTVYGKMRVSHTDPIIPFRETIIAKPKLDVLNEVIQEDNSEGKEKYPYEATISNELCTIRIRVVPLSPSIVELLSKNERAINLLSLRERARFNSIINNMSDDGVSKIDQFKQSLAETFDGDLKDCVNRIWSFGPNFVGCNILVNNIKGYDRPSVWDCNTVWCDSLRHQQDHHIIAGFQKVTAKGPLCNEPMLGVAFVVEQWELKDTSEDLLFNNPIMMSRTAQDCMVEAFSNAHQRLMVAMYSCTINVDELVIGKMYCILGKRHGTVTQGDIREGSTSWDVVAHLPVIESFNFSSELMEATSGQAMPQLVFSHWEVLNIDPFWEPRTSEELAHYGEKSDKANIAKKYMNDVRKRKGLLTDEYVVADPEKQRNLSRIKN